MVEFTAVLGITNAVYICAFSKSEEAIVNDDEEILIHTKEEDSPLSSCSTS